MSYTGTMTRDQALAHEKHSCPCPALPEGMVVFDKEDLKVLYNCCFNHLDRAYPNVSERVRKIVGAKLGCRAR